MDRPSISRPYGIAALSTFLVLIVWGCTSSPTEEVRSEDIGRTPAMTATSFLPPKTEIAFPPLPLNLRMHLIHAGSPVGGYEVAFKDRASPGDAPRSKSHSSCRLSCVGGDCAIKSTSEPQLFLQQGTFVVSYARMLERPNRMVAFLASLNRTFVASLVFLECRFGPEMKGPLTIADLLAQLPPGTQIDAKKNARFSLTESMPGPERNYEYATHRCMGKADSPYPRAALFVLTAKGIASFDARGASLDYKIPCRGPVGSGCRKISEFLESNGVVGCLY